MKQKEIEALESCFKTDDELWNDYVFEMLCEIIEQGLFENPKAPLQLFEKVIKTITDQYDTPLQTATFIEQEFVKNKFSVKQKLFLYKWINNYLRFNDFEDADISAVRDLLDCQTEQLKKPKARIQQTVSRGHS